MPNSKLNNKIVDAHVHCSLQIGAKELSDFLDSQGIHSANILSCTHSRALSLFPRAMELKSLRPEDYYAFGCPDVSSYYFDNDNIGLAQADYGKLMMSAGADGIKMLEGKPQMRKAFPIPDFDLPSWEPFFKWAEEDQIPILWHVNDPANFWDLKNAPSFAVACGWLYDETYINNEVQYAQVLNVLERHPSLRICFAHFFFMSGSLDRLADILDKYPNVYIDLTPGIEMYEDFSMNVIETKAFFEKYQKRICFGTDIGGRCVLLDAENKRFDELENVRRPRLVLDFLTRDDEMQIESDGHYLINRPAFTMRCLGLSKSQLDGILGDNFKNFTSVIPRKINEDKLFEFKLDLKQKLDIMTERIHGFIPDYIMTRSSL